MGFDTDVTLRPAGASAFDVEVPLHWRIGPGATNGGYIAAVVTRALEAAVADPERPVRSLTVHYLAACGPGPARIATTVERDGRSMATLSARRTTRSRCSRPTSGPRATGRATASSGRRAAACWPRRGSWRSFSFGAEQPCSRTFCRSFAEPSGADRVKASIVAGSGTMRATK